MSVGFVPWSDITEMKERKVFAQTFVNIVVKNPQGYIDKQSSAFKRMVMQMNYNSYGSVVGISPNGLKCTYKELKSLLDNRLKEYQCTYDC